MKGWVYIFSNKAMPDLLKVGFSRKDPTLRAIELQNTGVPHPYVVEYDALVEEPYLVEQKVHKLLKDHHEDKEWFRCNVTEAIIAIRKVSNSSLIHESIKNKAFISSQKNQDPTDAQAQFDLANLYITGEGVNKDLHKAFEWNLKAANQGLACAQKYIGYAYAKGQGVTKDFQKGMEWIRKATDQVENKIIPNFQPNKTNALLTNKLGDTLSDGSIIFYINTLLNYGLAAQPKDEKERVIWQEAKLLASAHGEGWHLPTKEELALLYDQRDVVGGFVSNLYWSATEYDYIYAAWSQRFSNGKPSCTNKTQICLVRSVCAFTHPLTFKPTKFIAKTN